MASQLPATTVRVERTADTAYGEVLGEIRSWLDEHEIKPKRFRPTTVMGRHGIGFEVTFNSPDEARQFEKAFPAGRWVTLPVEVGWRAAWLA